MHEVAQRRNVEEQHEQTCQATNNEREGGLGLLPRASGTVVPSVRKTGIALREQMRQDGGLLAANPRSKNNFGTRIFVFH